jgi:hypothetical protein
VPSDAAGRKRGNRYGCAQSLSLPATCTRRWARWSSAALSE